MTERNQGRLPPLSRANTAPLAHRVRGEGPNSAERGRDPIIERLAEQRATSVDSSVPMLLLRDELLDVPSGEFDDYRRAVNVNALRLGIVITVAVQIPFLLYEWRAIHEQFWLVQGLRLLWIGPLVALLPALRQPSRRLIRNVDTILWTEYVISAVFIVVVSFLDRGYQSPLIHTLVLMFVGVCAVTIWPFRLAAAFFVAVYGAYWVPLALGYGEIGDATNWIGYQAFMVGTMGIVLISQQLRLQMARADYDRRCQLEDKELEARGLLQRVAVMRQERMTWLESLARFLRHELRTQVVAMGTSLDLAENAPPGIEPDRYLGRARRSLAAMNRLVESATEATSLEAALAVESLEPVELSALVDERVGVFRRAHPERSFHADVTSGIEVLGQEDRIAQLLDKLLENAVRHVAHDGEIRVSLTDGDGEARLAVENRGEPLPTNRDELFDAFVTRANGKAQPHNLGLGLYVARAIAEAHGGHITAKDPSEAVGARFEVSLPST